MTNPRKRIDAHIHYALPLEPETLIALMDNTGTQMANLVLVPHRKRLTAVPDALMANAKYPDRFFVFTSFDVSEYYRHGKHVGKYMAKFVDKMRACGCDGLKIIEGKPSMRKFMAIPDFDLPCWEPLWAYAEKTQLPILWHVNDPETYWDPERVPAYAKAAGEFYDDSCINNEVQYGQVSRILQRHPNIKIIFAHFYFLSAQLPRLAALLDAYPNIMVDLTPGREIYENLSLDTESAKAFFETYQDRILCGTDIGARGVISSFGIGAFFSAPTAMPTQIAADEKKRTGRSHPSMYFAVQGIVNSLVGALGPGLIWVNLRNVSVGGNDLLGTHAMTYIVIIFCILAILACNKLPKEYDQLGRK